MKFPVSWAKLEKLSPAWVPRLTSLRSAAEMGSHEEILLLNIPAPSRGCQLDLIRDGELTPFNGTM